MQISHLIPYRSSSWPPHKWLQTSKEHDGDKQWERQAKASDCLLNNKSTHVCTCTCHELWPNAVREAWHKALRSRGEKPSLPQGKTQHKACPSHAVRAGICDTDRYAATSAACFASSPSCPSSRHLSSLSIHASDLTAHISPCHFFWWQCLSIEPRAWQLLGKNTTTELHPGPSFWFELGTH